MADLKQLEQIAREMRMELVKMSHKAGTVHLGSSLSCVDLIVALYWTMLKIDPKNAKDPNRDRFILSKGHAATTLYAILAKRGFFPQEFIERYAQDGAELAEHPGPNCVPGMEAATGSLGHGLSLGIGMALAARIKKQSYRVFALLSDGECNEGSVWEAALFAPAQKIDNLVALIDFNKWQATGRSEEIMMLQPLCKKWESFGWNAFEIDGNNMREVLATLEKIPFGNGKPTAIIANTVKGKGVSFMEDDNNWHYRIPTVEEVDAARKELGL